MPVWLWYCCRARSLWFFTPSNPSLTFGGFEGESKKEMYEQLPPGSYPRSIFISPVLPFEEAQQLVSANSIPYPFAVKPDVGMMGFMFRKINNAQEFHRYHSTITVNYFVQDLIAFPLEVSVFYYRHPDQTSGTITGFLKKEFLQVTGDGRSSLWELIKQYPRVQLRLDEMRSKHADRLNDILPEGETYILSHALNLSRGGRLVSLEKEKDAQLLAVFDKLSRFTKQFYYGRYDIKCLSIEDLKEGRNFSILEYNGCGAEPHHIYGNGHTIWQAYKIVLQHWKVLYRISRYNHEQGHHYWKFSRGWRFLKNAKKHFRMLKKMDREFPIT
jgi:hypothetical protein